MTDDQFQLAVIVGSVRTGRIAPFVARWMPVGFVSYGGMAGGLRAVEQLRLVFAELHAVTVRQVVGFHRVDQMFGVDGQLRDARAESTYDV